MKILPEMVVMNACASRAGSDHRPRTVAGQVPRREPPPASAPAAETGENARADDTVDGARLASHFHQIVMVQWFPDVADAV
jgi:hypothetical protein